MTLFPTQPNIPSPTTAARPVAVPAPGVSAPLGADDAKRARILADAIRARFAQTLVGQDNLRESLIVTLVAGGHILIESVPGLAKTTAAQTLATCVSGSFKRVQCTPDLMPSDLVGTQVFDFASQKFTTQIGPIHANFVLLDEINRSNCANPPLNGTRVMLDSSPNTSEISSDRRNDSAANIRSALAATCHARSPEGHTPVISRPTSISNQTRDVDRRSRSTTMGRPWRALVFQSIRRDSSPGS